MKAGWEIKKLGEVCEIHYGTRVVQKKDGGTIYPVYGGGGATFKMDKFNREDCLVVSRFAMSKQCVRFVRGKFFLNDSGLTIESKDSILSQNFLDKHIFALNDKIYSLGKGMAQINLDIKELKNIDIHFPISIPEQERIVSELDLISGVIEKKKQQLKELDSLAQSVFYEMFGNPMENEKGWEVKKLEELFDIGSSKRVFESQWTDSGVPFYRAREIVKLSKGENIESPIFISEDLYNEYSKKYGVPSKGDMMVTAVGTLGVCYIVKSTDKFYFKDGNTLWFKNKGICDTQFIKDEFATDFVVNQIKGNANAAVVGTYTITNAKKTKVIVPPFTLQKEYVKMIESIEKQKELIKQSLKETETLFDSRMDFYFN